MQPSSSSPAAETASSNSLADVYVTDSNGWCIDYCQQLSLLKSSYASGQLQLSAICNAVSDYYTAEEKGRCFGPAVDITYMHISVSAHNLRFLRKLCGRFEG
jgi:hypothetical protein